MMMVQVLPVRQGVMEMVQALPMRQGIMEMVQVQRIKRRNYNNKMNNNIM